jgi:hypothetical protein
MLRKYSDNKIKIEDLVKTVTRNIDVLMKESNGIQVEVNVVKFKYIDRKELIQSSMNI